jgi:hypothetical protein
MAQQMVTPMQLTHELLPSINDQGASANTAELFAIRRAHMLHQQLQTAIDIARKSKSNILKDIDLLGEDSPYIQALLDFYRENLALSRLIDGADLLIHAEGPGAAGQAPRLNTFNWLCQSATKQLIRIACSSAPPQLARSAAESLDFRLTGMATGSLYLGFSLEGLIDRSPDQPLDQQSDDEAIEALRQSIYALPIVPQYIGPEKVSLDILEALPDAALRDAAMLAARDLAPTGQRGIHTLEISAPRSSSQQAHKPQSLGQLERVVLRETLKYSPLMRNTKGGSFVGVVRSVDLDTGRITLRDISKDIPNLRASVRASSQEMKKWLDVRVKITGVYECNESGLPRLMRVDAIEPIAQQPLIE